MTKDSKIREHGHKYSLIVLLTLKMSCGGPSSFEAKLEFGSGSTAGKNPFLGFSMSRPILGKRGVTYIE
jgi:hypothetical protein